MVNESYVGTYMYSNAENGVTQGTAGGYISWGVTFMVTLTDICPGGVPMLKNRSSGRKISLEQF